MMIWERLNLEFAKPTKKLILLGSSGFIGNFALEYLRRYPNIRLEGISVHKSIEKLEHIIFEFQPKFVCISDEESFESYQRRNSNSKIKFFKGIKGLIELIEASDADTVLNALVGSIGVEVTLKSIEAKKKVCIANKESLITSGAVLLNVLKKFKAPIIPVDSEHNAIFQLLLRQNPANIKRILLTASGGPFRDFSLEQMAIVKKEQVLQHPTWNMGPKITVDSAGLINKGLEVIEAHYLFGFPYDAIDVKIHKKSYVHGLIETIDGTYFCLINPPSMIFPIAYSLHFPEPIPIYLNEAQKPEEWPSLEFENVDYQKYPGFSLCLEAGKIGNSAPLILNSANEVAVDLFLQDKILFTDIPKIIQKALKEIPVVKLENLNIILEEDKKVRNFVISKWN